MPKTSIDKSSIPSGRLTNLVSDDGTVLHTRRWEGRPDCPTIFIGHSQATHGDHFIPLAQALNRTGWTVVSGDLRAHGRSTSKTQPLVHLTPERGWDALIDDLHTMLDDAFKGVPFERRVVATQNITALLTLEVLKSNQSLAGNLILTLPANQPTVAMLARSFVRARMKFKAFDTPDEQTHHHLYSFLGARLRERRHLADVMTANKTLVDSIVADPLGFPVPTLGYWSEIFAGMENAWDWPDNIAIAAETRVLLLYGEEDPLVANGKLVAPIRKWFASAGLPAIDLAVIEGGRTAILLDEDTLGVSRIITDWVEDIGVKAASNDVSGETFEAISAQVLEEFGTEADAPAVDINALIALCYDAVDDETRWVEVLYRVALSMARHGENDTEKMQATLHSLMPHWDRSYTINRRVLASTALSLVLQTVIERLDIGTALLSGNCRVLHHNDAFRQTLRSAINERSPNRTASTAEVSVDADFAAVMNAEFRSQLDSGQDTSILTVDGHPLGFYFRPDALGLLDSAGGGDDTIPVGLLVLRGSGDDDSQDQTRISMLELSYGLTRQEAAVALHITRGNGPACVAKRLDISINTVRTHLKRTYEKMSVDGQTEMVARIMGGAIGWLAR